MMNDDQLLRYSRQIMLPGFDIGGQERLLAAHVLIVGLGGLGAPAAFYLTAAGVGTLTLADFDSVDVTNLQRQIVHFDADVGRLKVESAAAKLSALNGETVLHCITDKLEGERLREAVASVDLVLDCTDNFTVRFALNAACWEFRKPLVSGAAIRGEGQLLVIDPRDPDSACYRCLYDESVTGSQLTCSESGVLSPLVGVIGTLEALEAIKLLSGYGRPAVSRLQLFDAAAHEWRSLKLRRAPDCPVCSRRSAI